MRHCLVIARSIGRVGGNEGAVQNIKLAAANSRQPIITEWNMTATFMGAHMFAAIQRVELGNVHKETCISYLSGSTGTAKEKALVKRASLGGKLKRANCSPAVHRHAELSQLICLLKARCSARFGVTGPPQPGSRLQFGTSWEHAFRMG